MPSPLPSYRLQDFLQYNLKQEQGSCRRQAPVGLSIEMFKCGEEGGKEIQTIPPSYSPDNTASSKFIIPLWLFWELKKLGKLHTEVSPLLLRRFASVSPPPFLPPTISICQSAGGGVKNVKNGCLLSVWYYSHH